MRNTRAADAAHTRDTAAIALRFGRAPGAWSFLGHAAALLRRPLTPDSSFLPNGFLPNGPWFSLPVNDPSRETAGARVVPLTARTVAARCMRLRTHRQNLVVWNSAARPVGRPGAPKFARPARTRRTHRRIRTGVLLAVLGVVHLVRAVLIRRWAWLLLAGAALTTVGLTLPSAVAFICGMLVLLRGVAVTLGVSELRRRRDGEPAGAPDFFGFGTRPYR